jgi:hypothetical protein
MNILQYYKFIYNGHYALKTIRGSAEIDCAEAELCLAIINNAITDSKLIKYDPRICQYTKLPYFAENYIVKKARNWVSINNKYFKKYCNLIGLNEEWVFKVIWDEIIRLDNAEKQLVSYWLFSMKIYLLNCIKNNYGFLEAKYLANFLAKKVGVLWLNINNEVIVNKLTKITDSFSVMLNEVLYVRVDITDAIVKFKNLNTKIITRKEGEELIKKLPSADYYTSTKFALFKETLLYTYTDKTKNESTVHLRHLQPQILNVDREFCDIINGKRPDAKRKIKAERDAGKKAA